MRQRLLRRIEIQGARVGPHWEERADDSSLRDVPAGTQHFAEERPGRTRLPVLAAILPQSDGMLRSPSPVHDHRDQSDRHRPEGKALAHCRREDCRERLRKEKWSACLTEAACVQIQYIRRQSRTECAAVYQTCNLPCSWDDLFNHTTNHSRRCWQCGKFAANNRNNDCRHHQPSSAFRLRPVPAVCKQQLEFSEEFKRDAARQIKARRYPVVKLLKCLAQSSLTAGSKHTS